MKWAELEALSLYVLLLSLFAHQSQYHIILTFATSCMSSKPSCLASVYQLQYYVTHTVAPSRAIYSLCVDLSVSPYFT